MNKRVAVLVSGGGRSLENLSERCADGTLNAELALVVSNRSDAYALERAARLELPRQIIDPERELSPEDFSRAVFDAAESADCSLIVLAVNGFAVNLITGSMGLPIMLPCPVGNK